MLETESRASLTGQFEAELLVRRLARLLSLDEEVDSFTDDEVILLRKGIFSTLVDMRRLCLCDISRGLLEHRFTRDTARVFREQFEDLPSYQEKADQLISGYIRDRSLDVPV